MISLSSLLGIVSEFFNVRRDDLLSPRRTNHIAHARMVFCWLARRHTRHSYQDIGDFLRRDHATIMYAFHQVEHRSKGSDAVRDECGLLDELCGKEKRATVEELLAGASI